MANLNELREKETEEFITNTLVGLKAIKRETREVIRNLKDIETSIKRGDSRE